MEGNGNQPLLASKSSNDNHNSENKNSIEDDIQQINGVKDFFREFSNESKKLWYIAGPSIFCSLSLYTISGVTQMFAGQLGTFELAAVSVQNSVIAGFALGITLGMGSALETLCGQAFGAGQVDMLGIYIQRSWIILIVTAFPLTFIYVFASPILILIGQSPEISKWAGKYAIWMIPELYAYALYYPIQNFLQAQSKVMALAWISAAAMVLHIFFSWFLMLRLGWGLVGAAVVYNASWWFLVVAQLWYIFTACRDSWSGFSLKAFQNLRGFVKLSLVSAVMRCLEFWYDMALLLFVGYLKNAEIAVDALSICITILGWTIMIALGFNAAISIRVSNELGAGHPRAAKFSVVVTTITATIISICVVLVLLMLRGKYVVLFTNSKEVQQLVDELTPLLAFSIVTYNVQPVFLGVAIGAGWQGFVAYVNIICYYLFGIPLGLVLGFLLDFGIKGIWYGILCGTLLQTVVLFWMICKTNWNKEVSIAGERIKEWGGERNVRMVD